MKIIVLIVLALTAGCTSLTSYEAQVTPDYKEIAVIGKTGPPWGRFLTSDRFLIGPDGKPVYLKGDSTSNKIDLPGLPMPVLPIP